MMQMSKTNDALSPAEKETSRETILAFHRLRLAVCVKHHRQHISNNLMP